MTKRTFRLIIERNGSKFSDNCSVFIDIQTSFIQDEKYFLLSIEVPKWMRDMLGDSDYQLVKNKLDENGKVLWIGRNGMELNIKI